MDKNTKKDSRTTETEPKETKESEESKPLNQTEYDARVIGELMIPTCLYAVLPGRGHVGISGVSMFLDNFIKNAGDPSDPIERIMIEQMCVAHFQILSLQAKSADSKQVKVVQMYLSAARQLLGELRRTAESLKRYRGETESKSTTVTYKIDRIDQQNIAQNGGLQDVSHRTDSQGETQRIVRDTEVTSNDNRSEHDDLHKKREQRLKESASGCSRSLEPVKT